MKLVYFGSPYSAVPPLQALVAGGHEVLLVVSQPDRRRGRGSALSPSPVKAAALALGLPVSDKPDDALAAVAAGAELGVVVAYGRLIRPHLLAALPFVNLHFSLLPRWRGAAPVERAVLAGDAETGVCLMQLEEGLDTGPVYRRVATPIGEQESADDLRARLVRMGTDLLIDALRGGIDTLGLAEPQEGEPTYAAKIDPMERRLDWTETADALDRRVRVGGAWTTFRGERLKVLDAVPERSAPSDGEPTRPGALLLAGRDDVVVRTGPTPGNASATNALRLRLVQPAGRGPVPAGAWRNGAHLLAGETLGEEPAMKLDLAAAEGGQP